LDREKPDAVKVDVEASDGTVAEALLRAARVIQQANPDIKAVLLLPWLASVAGRNEAPDPQPGVLLTEDEWELLGFLAQGLSLKQMASLTSHKVSAIKAAINDLHESLGVSGRGEAMRFAVSRGLARPQLADGTPLTYDQWRSYCRVGANFTIDAQYGDGGYLHSIAVILGSPRGRPFGREG
jgi:DNA-binding CsgD family transcriptional regulator